MADVRAAISADGSSKRLVRLARRVSVASLVDVRVMSAEAVAAKAVNGERAAREDGGWGGCGGRAADGYGTMDKETTTQRET